jgi:PhnB protein
MTIRPYLYFNGRCDEALELYQKVLGAQVQFLMRFKEGPPGACEGGMVPAKWEEKVMHTEVLIGESTVMMSDGNSTEPAKFDGISLCALAKDEADAERIFAELGEGGEVQMPMMQTFFSPKFGMVADKLGVSWMVIVPQEM